MRGRISQPQPHLTSTKHRGTPAYAELPPFSDDLHLWMCRLIPISRWPTYLGKDPAAAGHNVTMTPISTLAVSARRSVRRLHTRPYIKAYVSLPPLCCLHRVRYHTAEHCQHRATPPHRARGPSHGLAICLQSLCYASPTPLIRHRDS